MFWANNERNEPIAAFTNAVFCSVTWKTKWESTFLLSFILIDAKMNLVGNYWTLRGLQTVNPAGLLSTSEDVCMNPRTAKTHKLFYSGGNPQNHQFHWLTSYCHIWRCGNLAAEPKFAVQAKVSKPLRQHLIPFNHILPDCIAVLCHARPDSVWMCLWHSHQMWRVTMFAGAGCLKSSDLGDIFNWH